MNWESLKTVEGQLSLLTNYGPANGSYRFIDIYLVNCELLIKIMKIN